MYVNCKFIVFLKIRVRKFRVRSHPTFLINFNNVTLKYENK